jgi:hypothetical protein
MGKAKQRNPRKFAEIFGMKIKQTQKVARLLETRLILDLPGSHENLAIFVGGSSPYEQN